MVEYIINWLTGGIVSAIQGLIEWIWNSVSNAINSLSQAIINAIFSIIINPIYGFINAIITRFSEKLKGIIFISIAIPSVTYLGKKLITEPSWETGLLFVASPFISYVVAEFINSLISGFLRPITISPPVPPQIPRVPQFRVIELLPIDSINISDVTSIELLERMISISALDNINISDITSVELITVPPGEIPVSMTDYVGITDYTTISLLQRILNVSAIDNISISDLTTVELITAGLIEVNITDNINVSDLTTIELTTNWLSGWQYRKSISIEGSSAGSVTDYQIRLTVHYGSGEDSGEHIYLGGNCRTDFGDVRFTDSDGVTLLPYWIEEKVDGDYAIFWVKVPYIPAYPDTALIYIYYGNPDATSIADGDATFIFFDDFTTLNTIKWTIESGSATVENGELKLVGSATFNNIRANLDLDTSLGYEWNYRARVNATNNGWGSYLFFVNTSNTYRYAHRDYYYTTLNQTRLVVYVGGTMSDVTTYISPPRDTAYHKMKVRKHDISWQILWDNYTSGGNHTPQWASGKAITFHTEVNFAGTVWVDYVFIRKYISPEPSVGGTTPPSIQPLNEQIINSINTINWTNPDNSVIVLYAGLLLGKYGISDVESLMQTLINQGKYMDASICRMIVDMLGLSSTTLDNLTRQLIDAIPFFTGYHIPKMYVYGGYDVFSAYRYACQNLYRLAKLWNYGIDKWNSNYAWQEIKSKCEALGGKGFLFWNPETGYTYDDNRFYDENAQILDWLTSLYEVDTVNNGGALAYARDTLWPYINNTFWSTNHYIYRTDLPNYECEGAFFPLIIMRLKALNGYTLDLWDRVLTDIKSRFINSLWSSPQWTYGSVKYYSVIHHNTANSQRRLHNTLGAWFTLHAFYPLLDDTSKANIRDMIYGVEGLAWVLMNQYSGLFDASTNRYRIASDLPLSDEATAIGVLTLFLLGIRPGTACLRPAIHEWTYECFYCFDDYWLFDYTNRKIRIPVTSGTLTFLYGSTPVNATFQSDGVYEITFSTDWNSITSITKISDLSTAKIYTQ